MSTCTYDDCLSSEVELWDRAIDAERALLALRLAVMAEVDPETLARIHKRLKEAAR